MKFGLQGLVLTGAMCIFPLLSNGQSSNAQSSNSQPSDTSYSNFPLINFEEGDYAHLDSAKMTDIKKKEYPYKKYIPTGPGITAYVYEQWESVIYDFQKFFNVQIYSLDFEVASLGGKNKDVDKKGNIVTVTNVPQSDFGDELGIYYSGEDYTTISNEEKYLGYSLRTAKKAALWDVLSTNKFVRAVMLHEIAHDYVQQVGAELKMEGYYVNPAFFNRVFFAPNSTFLEEGIAEYCPTVMGELIQGKKKVPESIDDMFDKSKKFSFYYEYSVYFVQDFLKKKGLHDGVRILLSNPPPTNEEILDPKKYFDRLNSLQKE